jgi:hypothetical protein
METLQKPASEAGRYVNFLAGGLLCGSPYGSQDQGCLAECRTRCASALAPKVTA